MAIDNILKDPEVAKILKEFDNQMNEFEAKINDASSTVQLRELIQQAFELFKNNVAPTQNQMKDFVEALPASTFQKILTGLPVEEPLNITTEDAITAIEKFLQTPTPGQ